MIKRRHLENEASTKNTAEEESEVGSTDTLMSVSDNELAVETSEWQAVSAATASNRDQVVKIVLSVRVRNSSLNSVDYMGNKSLCYKWQSYKIYRTITNTNKTSAACKGLHLILNYSHIWLNSTSFDKSFFWFLFLFLVTFLYILFKRAAL